MEYIGLASQLAAIDFSSGKLFPSTEVTYGPYNSIDEAYNALVNEFDQSSIPVGLTVGIKTGNNIKEYWFNGGTAKSNLVEKHPAGGGGSSTGGGFNIYTIANLAEDTTTALDNTFQNAVKGDHVIDTVTGGVYIKYGDGQWVKLNGTILTEKAVVISRIVNAHILSYK